MFLLNHPKIRVFSGGIGPVNIEIFNVVPQMASAQSIRKFRKRPFAAFRYHFYASVFFDKSNTSEPKAISQSFGPKKIIKPDGLSGHAALNALVHLKINSSIHFTIRQ